MSGKHVKLLFWLEVSWGKLWIVSVLAKRKDTLGSTLAVNSDLGGVVSDISNQDHHLFFLAEWDAHDFVGEPVSVDEHLVGVDVVFEEELNHGDFKGLSLWLKCQFFFVSLKPNIGVSNDCFGNKILH